MQPQWEQDLSWRCSWIGCSVASEPEPSDTRVSPTLHVYFLRGLQQWLCTLLTGVAVPVQYMVGFGWSYWNAWYSLVSYQGSHWVGKIRAWYPLFVHVLNFSEILGDRELSRCICTTVTFITYIYHYTAHTFSDQWWSSFDWGRDSHLSDAAFSGYFLWTIFLSPHHSLFLETVSTGNFKGEARGAPVPLLPLWLHVCTRTHSYEKVCWSTSHLLFSDIIQPQLEPDHKRRCSWIGCSIASEPEPSDTRVSRAIPRLVLKYWWRDDVIDTH